MGLRHCMCFTTFMLLLTTCGRTDSTVPASAPSTPTQPSGQDIANLLSRPSASDTAVALDAYNWIGLGRSAGFGRDAQGCPVFSAMSFLTDQPVIGVLQQPTKSMTNWSLDYPLDTAAWLIPVPTTAQSTSPFVLPYHARLRGHLDDPAFKNCAHAERIFVVESIVTVYQESPPFEHEMKSVQLPPNYAAWPRYHDANLGYSFAYAPDWRIETTKEPDSIATILVHMPEWPDSPLVVRIHPGETYSDPYNPASKPPLLQGDSGGIFNQDVAPITEYKGTQHLTGVWVERKSSPNFFTMAIVLNSQGRTYELALRYPIGLNAQQALLDAFSFFIGSFEFDVPPGPTPTPPVKQALGQGPFLSREEALAAAQKRPEYGSGLKLLDGRLVSEAELRKLGSICATFPGHPDGVWLLRVAGIMYEKQRILLLGLDATPVVSTPLPTVVFSPPYPAPSPQPYPGPTSTTP